MCDGSSEIPKVVTGLRTDPNLMEEPSDYILARIEDEISLRATYCVSFTSSPTTSIHLHALLLNSSNLGFGRSASSVNKPYCKHQVSGAWPSIILTGLPHSAHMLLCIGLPELVLGSERSIWPSPAMNTSSLGTMKAYEATPPDRRLQFEQWQTKLLTSDRGTSTETCQCIRIDAR